MQACDGLAIASGRYSRSDRWSYGCRYGIRMFGNQALFGLTSRKEDSDNALAMACKCNYPQSCT